MLTYQSEVQRPLLAPEVDANFRDLDRRLAGIESKGVTAVGISDLVADTALGTILVTLTNGVTVGPFPLPVSFFVPRGAWQTGLAYHLRDYVTVDGSSYVALADHKAGADFATDLLAGRWQLNSAKGRNGTDFGNFIGVYDPAHDYAAADMVLYNGPGGYALYRLNFDAPPGTAPGATMPATGGAPAVPYWTLQSIPPNLNNAVEIYQQGQGRPVPNTQQVRRKFARQTVFPVDFAGSYAQLTGNQASADMSFDVLNNGYTVATLKIPAGSRTGAFTSVNRTAGTTFAVGDFLVIILRTGLDQTAADLDFTLLGYLG